MSKMFIALLMALAIVVPVTAAEEATAVPSETTVSSGGWVSTSMVVSNFRRAWNQSTYSEKSSVCNMWKASKRLAVGYATNYLAKDGWYPRSNIRKGVRKVMRQKCRWL